MGFLSSRAESRPKEERYFGISQPSDLIPRRTQGPIAPRINDQEAMRHSAVWACLRLRADLVSTMPLGVYRNVTLEPGEAPIQVQVQTPPVLVNPGGARVSLSEWLYSSQQELDKSGNSIGVISRRDGNNMPAQIDLQATSNVSLHISQGQITEYRIGDVVYSPDDIWHEKQYTVSGMPIGLSPIAYAAYTLGEYQAVQQFVTNWFVSGAVPRSRLKNVQKTLDPKEAAIVKEAWRASQAMGEPFVHGNDWDYEFIQAEQASADWLEAMRFTAIDVARFFGVPADLVDAAVSGESITYANISQRNLQFLIMNLGPALVRREQTISNLLLSKPRYVNFDRSALLAMDPQSRAEMLRMQVESRQITPNEARAIENRPPFTQEQINEFGEFWTIAPPRNPIYRI